MNKKILIIRLGALGDIFLCMQAIQNIRLAHPDAHITMLTTKAFVGFVSAMPWINEVIVDPRASYFDVGAWVYLWRLFKKGQFTHVFDFQNKPRTNLYHALFFKNSTARWSGTAHGCTDPRPAITQKIHRQAETLLQIKAAGIDDRNPLDLDWLSADITPFHLPARYVLFIPGCSAHLMHKRWPPEHYAALAKYYYDQGIAVAVVGTKADATSIAAIKEIAPFIFDLTDKTNFAQLASLARAAECVIGNDTGPTFLSALAGAKTLTLMSHHTDPVLSGPVGPRCSYLKSNNVADITVLDVIKKMQSF